MNLQGKKHYGVRQTRRQNSRTVDSGFWGRSVGHALFEHAESGFIDRGGKDNVEPVNGVEYSAHVHAGKRNELRFVAADTSDLGRRCEQGAFGRCPVTSRVNLVVNNLSQIIMVLAM